MSKYKIDLDDVVELIEGMMIDLTPVIEKDGRRFNPRDKNGEIMINSDFYRAIDYNGTLREVIGELWQKFIRPHTEPTVKKNLELRRGNRGGSKK